MTVDERRNIVIQLLNSAHARADEEAAAIREEPSPNFEFVYEHLKKFIMAKFLLSPDESADSLDELIAMSLARTMKLDKEVLKKFDKAVPCDNVSSASAKKVMVLFAVQKNLGVQPRAEDLVSRKTVLELARLIFPLLPQVQASSCHNVC